MPTRKHFIIIASLLLVAFLPSACGSTTSTSSAALIKYGNNCAPGGSGKAPELDIPVPSTDSVGCNNGDGAGGLSSIYAVDGSSGVNDAITALSQPRMGFVCFVVGPGWIAVPQSESGGVSLYDDAQWIQQTLGGTQQGNCS